MIKFLYNSNFMRYIDITIMILYITTNNNKILLLHCIWFNYYITFVYHFLNFVLLLF